MNRTRELIRDPDSAFRGPNELLERGDLSVQEKLHVLRCWRADLVELQTATEENMADESSHSSGAVATRLTEVAAAITLLENSG